MTDERLPDAELEVLACLWLKGEITARQIRDAIEPYRPLAHASVLTLLGRLQTKGLISRRKGNVGKAFVYRATKKPDPTYRQLTGDVLQRIFGGNGVAMVASLFQAKTPTQDEISELEQLLADLKRKKTKTQRKRKSHE